MSIDTVPSVQPARPGRGRGQVVPGWALVPQHYPRSSGRGPARPLRDLRSWRDLLHCDHTLIELSTGNETRIAVLARLRD